MRRRSVPAVGASIAAVMSGALIWHWRTGSDTKAVAPAAAPPSVLVSVAPPSDRALMRRIGGFGEVLPGKTIGFSFPRGGQVTALNVVAGKRVVVGETLAVLSPDPSTVQAFQQALTTRDTSQRERDRLAELLELQLATRSQVDAAEKAYRDARSALAALEATGGGDRPSVIKAPFDGYVVSTSVAQGDRLAPNAPILQLGRVDRLRVRVGIDVVASRDVRPGAVVHLQPVGSAAQKVMTEDGLVSAVQDVVDPKTALVDAFVTPAATGTTSLAPGMKVRASIDVAPVRAMTLPRDAVLTDERGSYVFEVTGGKAHRRTVTKRLEADGLVAVDGIADPDASIVVRGNYELEDGMAVRVVPDAAGSAARADVPSIEAPNPR